MRNVTENLHKLILDEFGEKNALFVGQDVRANTIALRHKDSVKSLETAIYRTRIFSEDSSHTLRTYGTYDASDTIAPQLGQKRVLSGCYVPEFQNYEGKQNNKRARCHVDPDTSDCVYGVSLWYYLPVYNAFLVLQCR